MKIDGLQHGHSGSHWKLTKPCYLTAGATVPYAKKEALGGRSIAKP